MNLAEAGAAYGAAIARAAYAGDATAQRRARDAALADVPETERGAFWRAHDAAYRETWGRLEADADAAALTGTQRRAG